MVCCEKDLSGGLFIEYLSCSVPQAGHWECTVNDAGNTGIVSVLRALFIWKDLWGY